MKILKQNNRLRRLTFSLNETGVSLTDNSYLKFQSKEKFVSYQDLGIDIIKQTNYEGVPVMIFLSVIATLTAFVAFKNFQTKFGLTIFFVFAFLFLLSNIVFIIQKYLTKTYELTGGKQTIVFLRYDKNEKETLEFIQQLILAIKTNLIEQHNYLISNFKPNDKFAFIQFDTKKTLTDNEFKLLQLKNELLYRNLVLNEQDDDEIEETLEDYKLEE
jgi:hypothetical protein